MNEKRTFERFEIEVPARIKFSDAGQPCIPIAIQTDNLSAGGIFVQTDTLLPVGTPVTVELLFSFDELRRPEDPDGSLIIGVSGHVQRSELEGMAICFNDDYEILTALEGLEGLSATAFSEQPSAL